MRVELLQLKSLAVILCSLLAVAAASGAEDSEEADSSLSAELAQLPEAGRGSVLGAVVGRADAAKFKRMIVPELYTEVRDGRIEMDAVRQLRYSWTYDPEWHDSDAAAAARLTPEGALQAGFRLERGFVFGSGLKLQPEKDSKRLAQKILWNIHAGFWSEKIVEADFILRLLADEKVYRELRGRFTRVYPAALNSDDKTGQLFREIIRFNFPDILNRYSWLTFRFLGTDEDVVYLYSSVIKKVRQLSGSNRSDALANAGISAEDFLAWSGRPDQIDASVTGPVVALVPFAGVVLGAAPPDGEECVVIDDTVQNNPEKSTLAGWNIGSSKFPQAAPWLPTDAVFVPRPLWRVELVSVDPYSLYGRQVLYVDAESMLPVYKFVYDQAGAAWKNLIAVFGLAEGRDKRRYPYPSRMAVNDLKSRQAYMLDYVNVKYCRQFPAGMQLTDFQPGKLGPEEAPPAAANAVDKKKGKKPAPAVENPAAEEPGEIRD